MGVVKAQIGIKTEKNKGFSKVEYISYLHPCRVSFKDTS